MSRKPENTFISSVHKHLPTDLHYEKMNNPFYSGTADVWYSGVKADMWIEYKFIQSIPARDSTMIIPDLSKLQLDWLKGRYNEGRNVSVLIGSPKGGVTINRVEWERGLSTKEFKERLCSRKEIASQIYLITTGGVC